MTFLKSLSIVTVLSIFGTTACKKDSSETTKAEATPAPAVVPAPAPELVEEPLPPPVISSLTTSSTDDEIAVVGERALAMLVAAFDAMIAAYGDCTKAAAGLEQTLAEHATAVADAKVFGANKVLNKRVEGWLKPNWGVLLPRLQAVGDLPNKCKKDAAFKLAYSNFEKVISRR